MTAIQWLWTVVAGVLLIGGITYALWVLRRWFRPGNLKRPSGVVAAIVAFLLAWILVVLVILAWEVFKAARRPDGAQGVRMEATSGAA